MKLFFRKSKKAYVDHVEVFRTLKEGIKFYEKYTGVKYPWEKYDQIYCPDFTIGTMENVGATTLRDDFLQPSENQTKFS